MKEPRRQINQRQHRKHFIGKRRNFRPNRPPIPNDLIRGKPDNFPPQLDIPQEKLNEYNTGAELLIPEKARTIVAQKRLTKKKGRFFERVERVARAEILDTQQEGYIEADDGVPTCMTKQAEICDAVDIASATKHFSLDLRFGPYNLDYTLNGRYMLLGGRKGHVAAFDWMTKDLITEINVMETVRDIQWLHTETMFAVAQKRWLRIYDRNGTELHCIKSMFDIRRLEFLPRHFLLVGSGGNTFLTWLDVSVGKQVANFPTKCGVLNVLTQNQSNAIIVGGNSRGLITMWSPNVQKPLIEMFAHKGPILGISINSNGNYMATSGLDNKLRIWDLRKNYNELAVYSGPLVHYSHVAFSQRNFLAVNSGNNLQILKNPHLGQSTTPYLMHKCEGAITDLKFCPYEDVLGVGHTLGLSSLLIPGAGQANFDSLRANPFESKQQRKEREVKMLLDKIQPELITLNPADINRVNRKGLKSTMEYRNNVMHIKPSIIEDFK
uniref:BING4 C-terminal domain-containing protein n=1 Tax=Meloidogyne incognita TaxID=6306 RepID=A0A914MLU7_MELIC